MIKYVLHPGYIISKSDGEEHYISSSKLIELYKVNPAKCVVAVNDAYIHYGSDYIHLRPRHNGNYNRKE